MAAILVAGGAVDLLAQATPWVTMYYAGWTKWGTYAVDVPQIDFTTGTHWIFFTLAPSSNGTFDGSGSGIDATRHAQFVAAAHAAGKVAIIGTGGWGADYTGVVTNRTTSIGYLTNLMNTYGYDGVDVDWEPVPANQYANFSAWIRDLKAAMLAVKSNAVLTTAGFNFDQALADNRQYFDQINLMTYDMSGPWPGWVSWHNSALFNGGFTFPSTGGPLPSIDGSIAQYTAAGVPAAKLGFGIEFYGYVWTGVTAPRQTSFTSVRGTVPYFEIMDTYGSNPLSWDPDAQAAYYSTSNQFVSFDAETTMAVKANYVKAKGLGGVIVYEYAGGYRGNAPSGFKDRLAQSVKQAFLGGGSSADTTPPDVTITSPSSGASVSGQIMLAANATDNVAVTGVQFQIDGKNAGTEDLSSPYSASCNTWQLANGPHTVSATARDWSGNRKTASVQITVVNTGPPPTIPDKVVYSDALQSPFADASWSATVNYSSAGTGKNGSRSVQVSFGNYSGFDMMSGTWSNPVMIDPQVYDTLRFDIYPTTSFPLTIGYYNSSDLTVSAPPTNTWTTVSVPTPTQPFSRFYIGNMTGSSQSAYFDNIRFTGKLLTSQIPISGGMPTDYSLAQNFPNPFNPTTRIRYSVPSASNVTLKVYDLLGQRVATLVDGVRSAGTYDVVFDAGAGGQAGRILPTGVYLYQLIAGSFVETRRLILLK